MPLQFRRGNEAEFTSGKLLTGEPAYCTDTNHLFIGDAESGAVRIADQAYVDTKVAAVANGSPKGVFATINDLYAAYPFGANGIYIVRSNNHWYFWSGSTWSDGGPYLYNGDYAYEIPVVQGICYSGNFTFLVAPAPDNLFFGFLLRVNYNSAISWNANGTGVNISVSGVSGTYPLVANVGNAYYGKTLPAGVHLTVFSDGKWIILDAAQKLGCNFDNDIYVMGHRVITDVEINSDATLSIKRLNLGGDGDGNKAVTQANMDAALANAKAYTDSGISAEDHLLHKQLQPRYGNVVTGDPVVTISDAAANAEFNSIKVIGKTIETGTGEKTPSNPYTLSGVNPAKVTVCGKNTFDESILTLPKKVVDGQNCYVVRGINSPTSLNTLLNSQSFKPNTQYTLSLIGKVTQYFNSVIYIYTDGTLSSNNSTNTSFSKQIATSLPQKTISKIIVDTGSAAAEGYIQVGTLQLEVGTTATQYELYSGTTYPVSLSAPLYSLPDGTKDEFDAITGLEKHRLSIVVYNGVASEYWSLSATNTNTLRFAILPSNRKTQTPVICDKFIWSETTPDTESITAGATIAITINKSRLATPDVAGLKTWLTANPITVVFALSDSAIITYQHPLINIPQPSPICNITADGAPVSVDYTRDLATNPTWYFPATNLIQNGDFSKGATGWLAPNGTLNLVNNSCIVTGSGASYYFQLQQYFINVSKFQNKMLFIKAKIRALSADCQSISCGFQTSASNLYAPNGTTGFILNPVRNQWYTIYYSVSTQNVSLTSIAATITAGYADSTTANGKSIEVQYVLVDNLTDDFCGGIAGTNNEPTATQFMNMLSSKSNSWFDGTTNLFDAGYVLNRLNALDNAKADIKQEDWITPTLLNGWVDLNAAQKVQYMKDSLGFIHLRGFIKSGAIGSTAFTLPVGYRPSQYVQQGVLSNGGIGNYIINPTGNFIPNAGSNAYFSLDGIVFKAEA